jgi:S-DNA-T family DNA segregation ATPase FtsK/SpoIIIE
VLQRTMTGSTEKPPVSDEERASLEAGFGWQLLERLLSYLDDLGVILLSAFTLILTLGLMGLTHGGIVDPLAGLLLSWFGWGSYLFPLALALIVVYLIRSRLLGLRVRIHWLRIISLEVAVFASLGLLSLIDGLELPRAEIGHGGGIVGWGLATLFVNLIGKLGAAVILLLILLAGLLLASGGVIDELLRRRPHSSHSVAAEAKPMAASSQAIQQPVQASSPAKIRSIRNLPRAYRKNFRVETLIDDRSPKAQRRDERLPPLDILETGRMASVTSKEINLAAGLIEKTLADFGLPARVVDFKTGPAVTQFAVEPGYLEHEGPEGEVRRQKVRVSQILSLSNDLALALSAPRIRIEAPVPGHAYVGIEVPNRRPALVRLRPILETEAFHAVASSLAVALGRDVAGQAIAADLAAMPHLLIAGTTGSGKSVAIASLTCCLAMNNPPEDLRLVMIDPKMVELIRFNGLPHLIGKVETDLERIIGVLRWCTVEMDRRYRMLEAARARDIDMYNRRVRRRADAEHLPRMVVLIDELADLMMMAPDQTEHTLVRLAQMARATGIHLVVATQRPSTDIVTGLIKANFPARISFAVASGVDSRVILDGPGAETLLGKGDMLYLSPEASAPVRLQGALVTDREIERLIAYWQNETETEQEGQDGEQAPWEELLARQAMLEDRDEILEAAIELVKERGEASASLLQRALRVGYPRAARLMDELEELGVVGRAQTGGRTREVLIGEDEDPLTPDIEDDGSVEGA